MIITDIFSILILQSWIILWDILVNSNSHIVWILIDISHISFHFGWNERSGCCSFSYNSLLSSFVWTPGKCGRFFWPCTFWNWIGHAAIIKFYFYWFIMLKFKCETSGTSAIIWLITEHTATDGFSRKEQSNKGTGARRSNGEPNEIWWSGPTIFANSGLMRLSTIFQLL